MILILSFLFVLVISVLIILFSPQTHEWIINTERYTIDAKDKKRVIQKLRELHPKDFEEFIGLLFELCWYSIIYRSQWKRSFGKWYARKDWWIDLICQKWENKNCIQIKKLINQEVSVKIIREMWWVCVDQMNGNTICTIITTSLFSEDSLKFVNEKAITLIDYKKLLDIIENLAFTPQNKSAIEYFINRLDLIDNTKYIDYTKTCPLCLAPLVKRRWWFYGCMNYYKTDCRYTE